MCDIADPQIWRKLAVSTQVTFHELHLIIQAAMPWKNYHLYSFKEHRRARYFHVVSPYTEDWGLNARHTFADKILLDYLNQFTDPEHPKDKMIYEYDYGDGWLHEIDVLDFDRSQKTAPELLDGAGACPPEDCGSISGFQDLKTSLRTGLPSEIHGDSYIPWLEGCGYRNYDPDYFDLKKGQNRVKRWRQWESPD